MKRTPARGGLVLGGVGLLTALGSPVHAAPNHAAPNAEATAARSGFSYALPVGWSPLDLKNAPYPLRAAARPAGNDAATFTVQEISSALPPDRYIQTLLAELKAASPQMHVLSRRPFLTASGLRGSRAVFDEMSPGGSIHFVVCVFSGPGPRNLLAAGLWPASDTAKYAGPVDQALKTFTLKPFTLKPFTRKKQGQE